MVPEGSTKLVIGLPSVFALIKPAHDDRSRVVTLLPEMSRFLKAVNAAIPVRSAIFELSGVMLPVKAAASEH